MTARDPSRREVTRGLLALGAAGFAGLGSPQLAFSSSWPDVAVAHGADPYLATLQAIKMVGGIERFVWPGAKVLVYPNIISPLPAPYAVNTHADVVRALAELCVKAGGDVQVYHHHDEVFATEIGIRQAVEGVDARMVHMPSAEDAPERYRQVPVPMGRTLDSMGIADLVLDTDVLIDVPVAKHHAGSETSMAIKNFMGVIDDPRSFHYRGLHDCLADMATAIRPDLVVTDASTVMLTNGPSGPGQTRAVGEIIASTDMVAADAYGATLVDRDLRDVSYLIRAHEQRVGECRLHKLRIEKLDV